MGRGSLPMAAFRAALLLCFAMAGVVAAAQEPAPPVQTAGKKHPSLIRPDSTSCATCHQALLKDKAHTHPPAVEDCGTCHTVTIGEGGTSVTMSQAEPALCVSCHDSLGPAAAGSLASPHPPVTDSCVACHDPHASNEERLLHSPSKDLCATCHDRQELAGKHGGQITTTTNCIACHDPHGSAAPHLLKGTHLHRPFAEGSCAACHLAPFADRIRLVSRGERVCISCHGDLEKPAAQGGSIHPALKGERGKAGCLSCHEPHVARQAKLLLAQGTQVCAPCHDPIVKAAKAPTGHRAAADDCTTCHFPHASGKTHLLKGRADDLCRACHDPSDAGIRKAHLGADLAAIDCISCHSPHGAGQPNLLAKYVHAPVTEGCDTCHEGSADKLVEKGESALCLGCHAEVGEGAAKATVKHPAMEVARCADCHNPHASSIPKLVKKPGGAVCTACHEDKAAGAGETAHGVITILGCQACHEPHGSSNPRLLRKAGSELCLVCHGPGAAKTREGETTVKVLDRFEIPVSAGLATLHLTPDGQRGHPTVNHPVLRPPPPAKSKPKGAANTYEGELSCMTCHQPHKGKSRSLLAWDAVSGMQACLHCHPK